MNYVKNNETYNAKNTKLYIHTRGIKYDCKKETDWYEFMNYTKLIRKIIRVMFGENA